MRALIVVVLLVVVAVAVGWITMDRSNESVNIRINTKKVEADAERVIEGAKEAVNRADNAVTPANEHDPATSPNN